MKPTPVEIAGCVRSSQSTTGDGAILERGRAVLATEALAIQQARERLGPSVIEAVKLVQHSRGRVCVTGVGKAGLIGAKIQATLSSTGTLSYTLHPVEALHGDLGMIHPDDTVIALSKSGSTELIELLPRLKRIGCRVILITARPDSPAAQYADCVLDIGDQEEACPLGLAPSSSTAAMLAVGDALALTVMELKAVDHEQYASYHPGGALGRVMMKVRDLMRTGADCPTVLESATLSDCYTAILKAPRRAGAAAVVNDENRLVGIVTQGDFFRLFSRGMCDGQTPISKIATKNPKSIRSADGIVSALPLMRQYGIDELPVVDNDGTLVGMVDIQDLIARGFTVFDTA